jgi:hypothetical protein
LEAGRAAVEEAQLARALLRRMADDLRSAVPDPSEAELVGTLVGNREELQVTIRRTLPRSRATVIAAIASLPADRVGDLCMVNYRIAEAPGGLVRCQRDYATAAWAANQGKPDDWRRTAPVVAPEVEAVEFVYFQDGVARERWNSSREGRLPSAVKISLTLRRAQRVRNLLIDATPEEQRPSAVYSLLVHLPERGLASEPQDTEEQNTPSGPSKLPNE